ncbi:MAG: SLC13 family permease [Micavibrio aeruginosavorus]|uniref:SLC13 family permease n=1 Tax=Micavibrio aeruginosavorus TaxID=349221 RepID=A0A2W5FQU7_9BACT|nr:MAG: SLC13 family permease [Micavibrio aeruginosavorus]
MTQDQMLIFGIIALALVLFIIDKWRYDIVALFILFLSVVVGVVPAKEAFTGFSDPVVITVAAILIISAAVGRSGFINWVLKIMSGFIDKPRLQIAILVTMVVVLSAFMNNVGALAVFLPIALSFARKAQRSPSELLMPLSFGSLLGGLITLIGTPPNLLIANIREEMVGEPYKMFDFAPVGIGICAAGILYLSVAWVLLPKDRRGQTAPEDQFEINDYVSEVKVPPESPIIGQTVSQAEEMVDGDLQIIGIIKNDRDRVFANARRIIRADDHLILRCDPMTLKGFVDKAKLELAGIDKSANDEENAEALQEAVLEKKQVKLTSEDITVVEAVITKGSDLINTTPRNISLRSNFGINLLAVKGQSGNVRDRLKDVRFREGDVVVFQGAVETMPEMLKELGCLPLAERNLQLGRPSTLLMPIFILLGAVILTVSGVLPISIAFLGGVILIAVLKIMRLNELYEAIDWPVIMLLGAMIPVTQALQTTGGTEILAQLIADVSDGFSGPALLVVIMVVSMMVTPFLNNAAAVLLMAPIAGTLALKLGMNIDPFLMAVAVGTSCDFLTPIGHQSNTLVMGPGGYKFNDYWRLGLPLSILVVVIGVPLIMWIWPITG